MIQSLEVILVSKYANGSRCWSKKSIFASASPPIIFPNVYGIDMPYVKELIAYNKTIDEICDEIALLAYLSNS